MIYPNFIGATYASASLASDGERCMNLLPERVESGAGKNAVVYYSTPGLLAFATLPQAPIRAEYEINGRLFVIAGAVLYEVFSGGGYNVLGSIAVGPNVSMESNGASGHQLCIVSAGLVYIFDLNANTLTPINIAANGFTAAAMVVYLDGYFIAFEPSTQEFFISNLFDGTQWQALNYALAEGGPDNIVSLLVNQRELWLLGAYRTEIYYDSGALNFPLARNNNAYVECGCAAQFSVAKFSNTIAWLGRDKMGSGVVYLMNGYTPQRISTHAVEAAIQKYPRIDDATAYTYQDRGHTLYRLDFPSGDATWEYDLSTQLWHERGSWDTAQGAYKAHVARTHAFAFGRHIVGDYTSGKLYVQSAQYYSDAGNLIRRMRRAPHLTNEAKETFYSEFTLDMQVGVGLDGGVHPGANPQVMLRYSNDGGYTWSQERAVSAGAIGATKTRVTWRRLGRARDRVFEIVISDPVFVMIANAYLELAAGAR